MTKGSAAQHHPRPRSSPDHRCRIDDPKYENVWEWWEDHQGKVPITMAHALSQYRQRHGCTFGEAYQALVDRGAIVLIGPGEPVDEV